MRRTAGRIGLGLGLLVAGVVPVVIAATAAPTEATDTAGAAADPPSAAIVGDSILVHTERYVVPSVRLDREVDMVKAQGGSGVDYHRWRVVRRVREPDGPDVLLVFLGTAESNKEWSDPRSWRTDVRRFMEAVAPHVTCVRWFDVQTVDTGFYRLRDERARPYNRILRQELARFDVAEPVHYAQWRDLAGDGFVQADRLHPNDQGARDVAALARTAANGCDPALRSGPFWDVADDYWAADAVEWAAANELASGYGNGSFRGPIGSFRLGVTRGQFLSMVWQLLGGLPGVDHGWSDVPSWLAGSARWAWATGAVEGFPDGTLRPGGDVTRGQAVSVLWQLAGAPTGHAPAPWPDVPGWLAEAAAWAAAPGDGSGPPLVDGLADGLFHPDRPLDRDETVVALYRYAHRPPAPPPPGQEPDSPTTAPPAPPTSLAPTTTAPATVPPTTLPPTTLPPTTLPPTTVPAKGS